MNLFFFFVVAFIVEVHVHATDHELDHNELPHNCGRRVVTQNRGSLGEYPWLVKLLYDEPKITRCGGALLTEEWVISTATCLRKYELQAVMVGKYDTSDDWDCLRIEFEDISQRVKIKNIFFHTEHDIGLLKLNKGVRMNNYVNTICKPVHNHHAVPGMIGQVAGWSHLDQCMELYNSELKSASLKIINNTECGKLMNTTIEPRKFCAKPISKATPCVAMPGGPFMGLQYGKIKNDGRFYVAGIMMEEEIECDTNKPLVFFDISYLHIWITNIIRKPNLGVKNKEKTSRQG